MVRISKKAKIEPVREANELAVANEYVKEEVKAEWMMIDMILEDVKKMCLNNEAMGMSPKLWFDEIKAILNKYL